MQDKPSVPDLVAAVAHFLRDEILPIQRDPRLQFRLRVALNALGILERETQFGKVTQLNEVAVLSKHLEIEIFDKSLDETEFELNSILAQKIRTGNAPNGTLNLLLELSRAKLAITSPKTLKKYENSKHMERK
jgi:hypothetical protein